MTGRVLSLVLIFSLVPLSPLAIDVFLPSMPEMVNVFGVSENEMHLTIPIYIYALGVFQLIAGIASDKWGRRSSAMIGLAVYVVGSFAAASAPSIWFLYSARVIQGIGAAFTMVTAMAWVRDNYEGEAAGKWLSYLGGLTGSIPMVAPMIGGGLALIWGWQSGFIFMGLLAAILFLLAPFALGSPAPAAQDPLFESTEDLTCNARDIFGNTQFRTYSFASLMSFGGLLTYVSVAPTVAMVEGGFSEIEFALLFGAVGFVQIVSSIAAPTLVSFIGQRETVATGLVLAILGGVGLLTVPTGAVYWFFGLAALGGAGFSLLIGTATSLNLQPFKHCAGLAASLDGTLRLLGGASIAAIMAFAGFDSTTSLAVALLVMIVPLFFVLTNVRTAAKMVSDKDTEEFEAN